MNLNKPSKACGQPASFPPSRHATTQTLIGQGAAALIPWLDGRHHSHPIRALPHKCLNRSLTA
nr:MAG TPA: hypothetical protein [Caudoviricetes sp.]